jgi:ABC-type nitrate/sulfonate/bicarbonate transport system substrate-binding protein
MKIFNGKNTNSQQYYSWRFKNISLVLVLLSFILSGCRNPDPKKGDAPLTEIKLAVLQVYSAGLLITADRSSEIDGNVNCFAEAGLKPIIIKRSKGPEVVDALLGGAAEVGTLAVTPQAMQAVQGNQLVAFTTIQTADKDIKVIGHRSFGIKSGSSLKGKKVGYVGGTYGEIFLSRYLTKHGLKKSDVLLTSAPPAQLRDLLISKSLDAVVLWEPFIQDILRNPTVKEDDFFLDVDSTIYKGKINLLAKPDFFQKRPEDAKKLVKALTCGEKLIQKYPDKAQASIEKWLDRQPGTLNKVFNKETFKVELNIPELLSDLKEESKWALESVFSGKGAIPKDFAPFIYSPAVKSNNLEKVPTK